MATTQEAVQISAIVPTLTVDDLQKSISFYEALGFRRRRYRLPHHAVVSVSSALRSDTKVRCHASRRFWDQWLG